MDEKALAHRVNLVVAPSHREINHQLPRCHLFICFSSQIVGPKATTVPQAGLDTAARDGPLAQLIVEQIISNPDIDPNVELLYNPVQWSNAQNVPFNVTTNWLQPPVKEVINGRNDAFSQR